MGFSKSGKGHLRNPQIFAIAHCFEDVKTHGSIGMISTVTA